MLSTLAWTMRTVVKRLAADWLIVAAALVTILLSCVLLASGPVYAEAVTISSLQRSIQAAPVTDSALEIEVDVFPEVLAVTDEQVRRTVSRSLGAVEGDVFAHVEAESYGATERTGETTDLISFQYFEDIESRASLVAGDWPTGAGSPIEVAVNEPAAQALDVAVGDVIQTANRRDAAMSVTAEVVGVYRVDDPGDAFWFDDDLTSGGRTETASFTTHGPFVVSLETMLDVLTSGRTAAAWRVIPDYTALTVAELDRLRVGVDRLGASLERDVFAVVDHEASGADGFTVTSGLTGLLGEVDRSLTVTRSSVLALLIQLAILAGYALVLTAGLLVDTRRTETTLLGSRGTSPGHIASMAVIEGLILTVPAVIVGPALAAQLLTTLNTVGPIAGIGLTISPRATTEAYALAAIAALLAVVALAWPAWRSARAVGRAPGRHRRQQTRVGTQRIGVDIALVLLAVLVFWQLQELGPQVSARVRGRFGVDPLLVVAPALGLLTGAILALRIVPLLARLAEWAATARNSTVSALASWQVARRPVRYARSSLLLMMAIAIGFFAAAYSTTWTRSQHDQADFRVGADLAVAPDRSAGAMSDLQIASGHRSIPAVEQSMPVVTFSGQLSGEGGTGQFVVLDAAKARSVVSVRPDLSPDFATLMARLEQGRPTPATLRLEGEPTALLLEVEAIEEMPEEGPFCGGAAGPKPCFNASVRVVLRDGDGMLHRVDAGVIPVNEGPATLEAALTHPDGEHSITPTYPLSLVNIEVQSQVPNVASRSVELRLIDLSTVDEDGTLLPVPGAGDPATWAVDVSRSIGAHTLPAIRPGSSSGDEEAIVFPIETGLGFRVAPAHFSIRPEGTSLPATFPVVVSRTFLTTNFAEVGDQVRLPSLRIPGATGTIVGTAEGFPTIDPSLGELILLDLPTYQILRYEPGIWSWEPDTYWLSATGDEETVTAMLQRAPFNSLAVDGADELADALTTNPVALGTIGALTVGFVAAAVFAAVGFAVSATVSARERMVEFALLRALGLTPRQLGGWLMLEQGVLVLVSLALGTVIGVVLTAAILPLISLTQSGSPALPEVIVSYPWDTVVSLEIAILAVLGVIVAIMALLMRRIGLGSLLRLGED